MVHLINLPTWLTDATGKKIRKSNFLVSLLKFIINSPQVNIDLLPDDANMLSYGFDDDDMINIHSQLKGFIANPLLIREGDEIMFFQNIQLGKKRYQQQLQNSIPVTFTCLICISEDKQNISINNIPLSDEEAPFAIDLLCQFLTLSHDEFFTVYKVGFPVTFFGFDHINEYALLIPHIEEETTED
jgi:hypothetical protein